MYAIATELGRFEGENKRAAERKLRAAEKQAEVRRAINKANRESARLHAAEVAADIMEHFIDDDPTRGWRTYEPGNSHSARIVYDDEGESRAWLHATTEHGEARIELYRPQLVGSLMNGAGWTTIVWLRDGENVEGHAVGCCGDQGYLYRLPAAIQPDFFSMGKAP